jgi:hypothetical protein
MMKTTRISYNLDNQKSFKIKIALMVAVIVCFIGGLTMTTESKQKANHDINKISVSVISIQLNNPVSGNQSLDLTCSIENKSKSTLNYVKADISFSDKSGALLGTIEITFGSYFGQATALNLQSKKTTEQTVRVSKSANLNGLFERLNDGSQADLDISYKIIECHWAD